MELRDNALQGSVLALNSGKLPLFEACFQANRKGRKSSAHAKAVDCAPPNEFEGCLDRE